MKDACTPIESASAPCANGTSAPPTMAMHRMPEPCPVYLPSPFSAILKMVGNMIELHRPTARTAHIATLPLPNTAPSTSAIASKELNASVLPGLTTRITTKPMKRPTIAPPQ
ncbi:hypothetical protein ASE26_21975 [Duganella sp. Root198D2]|nr:hypothetical protein ASE26_21975 [Duganella sp. Root198D2]